MPGPTPRYPPGFKREAVHLYRSSGKLAPFGLIYDIFGWAPPPCSGAIPPGDGISLPADVARGERLGNLCRTGLGAGPSG